MRWKGRLALAVVALSLSAGDGNAKEPKPTQQVAEGPRAAQLAALARLRQRVPGAVEVRWDAFTGSPRSVVFAKPVALGVRAPKQAVERALALLAPVFGVRPQLRRIGRHKTDSLHVLRFQQTCGGVTVDGCTLRLAFDVGPRSASLAWAKGRVARELPAALTPATPFPRVRVPASKTTVRFLNAHPTQVVARYPDGRWRRAREVVRGSKRVLLSPSGKVLGSRPFSVSVDSVQGRIVDWSGKRSWTPLPDLVVQTPTGSVVSTAKGRFPYSAKASLPGGLFSAYERIVPRTWSELSSHKKTLGLDFADGDARLEDLTAYAHLAATRRWLTQTYGDVPGVTAASRAKVLVVIDPAYAGAAAVPGGGEMNDSRYDGVIYLGSDKGSCALDPSAIIHERIHVLLTAMGFPPTNSTIVVHEALSDYFAAVRTGNPRIGAKCLASPRDISQLRLFPRHLNDAPHVSGIILAGALWDARKELGAIVDRLVLQTVSRLGDAGSIVDFATTLLRVEGEATWGHHRDALVKHLARHGLVTANSGGYAPRIRVTKDGVEVRDRDPILVLPEALDFQLAVRAENPDGSPVDLFFGGLADLREGLITNLTNSGNPAGAVLRLDPKRIPAGLYELTVSAQDQEGDTSGQVIKLIVVEDAVTVRQRISIHAQVDKRSETDLSRVLVTSADKARLAGARYQLIGARIGGATIVGDKLIVRPRPGEEGIHPHHLVVHRKGVRRAERVDVRIHVGAGPWIEVYRDVPKMPKQSETSYGRMARLPAGQVITLAGDQANTWHYFPVEARAILRAVSFGMKPDMPATITVEADPNVAYLTPEIVSYRLPKPARDTTRMFLGIRSGKPSSKARRIRITLVATANGRTARRPLDIVLLPRLATTDPKGRTKGPAKLGARGNLTKLR